MATSSVFRAGAGILVTAALVIVSVSCGAKGDKPSEKAAENVDRTDGPSSGDKKPAASRKKVPGDRKAQPRDDTAGTPGAADRVTTPAPLPAGQQDASGTPQVGAAAGADSHAAAPATDAKAPVMATKQVEQPAPKPDPSRPPLADPRLLLTMSDVSRIAPAKARFRRAALAGMPRTEDGDSIMYAPEKGDGFGFSLQLFRTRNAQETKKRYDALHASYPNSQEISSVSGKTFFSYWDEIMHIGFVQPAKNMVVVVSCGRGFCDSNQLMELAGTVAERLK